MSARVGGCARGVRCRCCSNPAPEYRSPQSSLQVLCSTSMSTHPTSCSTITHPLSPCSINRMLEDQTLGLLSCLVVDELHMVGWWADVVARGLLFSCSEAQ